jgi:hypothetical protein
MIVMMDGFEINVYGFSYQIFYNFLNSKIIKSFNYIFDIIF